MSSNERQIFSLERKKNTYLLSNRERGLELMPVLFALDELRTNRRFATIRHPHL